MQRVLRRRRLRLLAFVLGLPILVLGPWAYAATSAPEVPTISFTATGAEPLVCGTRPNVTSLVIRHGTRVIIANRTGVAATVDIGRRRLLELADGTGALIRLRRGQHELQLIPQCVVVSETEKAVVQVLTGAQMGDLLTPSPSPGGDRSNPDEAQGPPAGVEPTSDPTSMSETSTTASSASGASSTSGATSASGRSTAPQPSPTGPAIVALDPAVVPAEVLDGRPGPNEIAVVELDAIPLAEPGDSNGLRLLAAIATICVLGVTAAIFRAIVSERTSRSVG